jgi:hypothetical protein
MFDERNFRQIVTQWNSWNGMDTRVLRDHLLRNCPVTGGWKKFSLQMDYDDSWYRSGTLCAIK